MTTSQRETKTTTTTPNPLPPQLGPDYKDTTPPEEQPTSCSSSDVVACPPLVNTVFAISSEQRKVTVNVSRIKASLEALEKNRELQKMGNG